MILAEGKTASIGFKIGDVMCYTLLAVEEETVVISIKGPLSQVMMALPTLGWPIVEQIEAALAFNEEEE